MSENQHEHPAKAWFAWAKQTFFRVWKWAGVFFLLMILTAAIAFIGKTDYQLRTITPESLSPTQSTSVVGVLHHYDWRDEDFSQSSVRVVVPKSGDTVEDIVGDNVLELGRAKVSKNGLAMVEVKPPELQAFEDKDRTTVDMVIHAEHDGEDLFIVKNIPVETSPIMAISLDRPLYQPGQRILFRTVLADKHTGAPLKSPLKVEIRDSKRNLVYQEDLATSNNGIASGELLLATPCVQGEYVLTASAGTTQVEKRFDVRPFRLPRFKVDVAVDQMTVGAGDTISGRVKATYTYGDPVKDADVKVDVQVFTGTITGDTLTGKTSENGEFTVNWPVPAQTQAGARIEVRATVASQAGRAEVGSTTVRVAGGYALVVYPADRAQFLSGSPQDAIIHVTDAQSKGVADVQLKLTVAESGGEREVEGKTDALGYFRVPVTPQYNGYITVKARFPNGMELERNLNINPQSRPNQAEVAEPRVRALQEVEISTPANADAIVVRNHGRPILAVDATKTGTQKVTLPKSAMGLSEILVISGNNVSQPTPVWVAQPETEVVTLDMDKSEYRPGEQATLDLSFPAPKETQEAPVSFGVVGVDEALYALKERSDVPLPVLMRGVPANVVSVLAMPTDGGNANEASVQNSKLKRSLKSVNNSPNTYQSDITRDVRKARRAPLKKGWALMLYLLLFVLVGLGARETWVSISKSAFSWRRVGALVLSSILAGVFAGFLTAIDEDALAGGLFVWFAVVSCWILGASQRSESIRLDSWLGYHLLVLAAAGLLAGTVDGLRGSVLQEFFPVVAAVIPLIAFSIQALMWVFISYRENEWYAAFGLATIAGALSLGSMGALVFTAGVQYEKAAPAQFAMPASEPMAEMAEDRASGMSGKKMKAMNTPAAGRGAPADAKPAQSEAPRVRSWFPETMVWIPEVTSDASGNAQVKFELPDSITTWRLNAWANTVDGRFGEGQLGVKVIQDFFIELDLPTNLTVGDELEIPVTFVNNASQTRQVIPTVVASPNLQVGTLAPVEIAGGQRTLRWLKIKANGHGSAELTVTAGEGDAGDAVKRSASVRPDGRELRDVYSGMVSDGWVSPMVVPTGSIPETMRIDVEIYPSIVADALEGLDAMLRSPSGCFEQTSSANYPNVMVLKTLKTVEPAKWPKRDDLTPEQTWQESNERAETLVRLGYQKMLTFQKPNGGFALYPKKAEPRVMLTAYGLIQLSEMKQVTFVDKAVMTRAANFLTSKQNDDGSWPIYVAGRDGSRDYGQIRGTAFVALSLLKTDSEAYKSSIDRALDRLETRLDAAEAPDALALAANAFALAGRKASAGKAIQRLESSMTREKDYGFWGSKYGTWMGGYGRYADVETTAMAAYAMIVAEEGAESLPKALNYLSNQRSGYGGWGTTQATVWTLRTLGKLRSKAKAANLQINLDGDPMPTANGRGEPGKFKVEATPQPLVRFSAEPKSTGNSVVTVASDADTAAMAKATVNYHVDWNSAAARNSEKAPMALSMTAPATVAKGDVATAVATVRNITNDRLDTLIIELPIIPGAYVPADQFEDMQKQGLIDEFEVMPTHVRLYVTQLGGKQSISYSVQFIPFLKGSVTFPPLRAYRFYTPEPVSEFSAGRIQVQ